MPTKRTPHRAPPGFVSKIPTTASTDHRPTNDSAEEPLTMKHDRIRAGSPKRSTAANQNSNVSELHQPDDPGEGTGGPKHEAPDTAGASVAEEVERDSRRAALKEAVTAGLYAALWAVGFIGLIWGIVWLAG